MPTQNVSQAVSQQYGSSAQTHAWTAGSRQPALGDVEQQSWLPGQVQSPGQVVQSSPGPQVRSPQVPPPQVPQARLSTLETQRKSQAVSQHHGSSAQTHAWTLGSAQPGVVASSQQAWVPVQGPQSAGQLAQSSPGSQVASPHAGTGPQLPQPSESTLATQNESQAVSQQ